MEQRRKEWDFSVTWSRSKINSRETSSRSSSRGSSFFSSRLLCSDKFTRFCQWKNLELNMQLTMNDFSVHRIIGRGGFGEVYGCRKADTGKM